MLTDQRLEEFLFISEGGNRKAYDDKQPWLDLKPGDEIKGTLTYGPGFTTRPDGSPVQIGDTMTDQEAYDRLKQYIKSEIEPVLEDLVHVPIAASMANALGSLVFNFGASEVYKWRLWGRINSGESPAQIIKEWVTGTFFSGGEPMLGLWRRRFKELALAFDVDWRAGDNADWETDPEEFLQVLGWDGTMPKPAPIVHEDLFEPEKPDMSDPTPESPMTMDDRQYLSAKAVGYDGTYADFMGHRTVVTAKNAIEAPNVDVTQPPKPIEDSKTGVGIAKEASGKDDVRLATILSSAGATATVASTTSEKLSETMHNTQTMIAGLSLMQLAWAGMIIGIPFLIYGGWKMYRGWQIKREGRATATQLKV